MQGISFMKLFQSSLIIENRNSCSIQHLYLRMYSTSISEADCFSIRDEQTVAGYILFSGAGIGMSFRTLLQTGKVFLSSTFFSVKSKQTLQALMQRFDKTPILCSTNAIETA